MSHNKAPVDVKRPYWKRKNTLLGKKFPTLNRIDDVQEIFRYYTIIVICQWRPDLLLADAQGRRGKTLKSRNLNHGRFFYNRSRNWPQPRFFSAEAETVIKLASSKQKPLLLSCNTFSSQPYYCPTGEISFLQLWASFL
jgi:hypothetical protein